MGDLLHYVTALAVCQKSQVKNAPKSIFECGLIVVDHAMKNSKQSILLDDLISALLLGQQVTYEFDCNLLGFKVFTAGAVAERDYFLHI